MCRKCTRCETVELHLASRVDNQRNELGRWVYSYIRVHRNNCFKSKLIVQNSMKTCKFNMDSSTAISAPKFVYYIKYYFTCTFCHLIYCKYHPLFILLEDLWRQGLSSTVMLLQETIQTNMLPDSLTMECSHNPFPQTIWSDLRSLFRHICMQSMNHCVSDMKIRAHKSHEMRQLGTVHPLGINERFCYI